MIELVRASRNPGELALEFGCHVTSILNLVRQAEGVSGVMLTQSGALNANERQELIELRPKPRQVQLSVTYWQRRRPGEYWLEGRNQVPVRTLPRRSTPRTCV